MEQIGNKIKQAREKMGLTQQNLASSLNMSTSTINKLEKGKLNDINTRLLKLIGNKLNITFEI